jgi:hypothetical protein
MAWLGALAWLAVAAFLVFFLVGWWVALLLIVDIWKREYVPAAAPEVEPAPAPSTPTPWQRLPDAARTRIGAPEPPVAALPVRTPRSLRVLRVLAVVLFVALAAAWHVSGHVVHACLLMSASLAALVLAVNWLRKT